MRVVVGCCRQSEPFGIGRWKVVTHGEPMLAALAVASYDGHRRTSMSSGGWESWGLGETLEEKGNEEKRYVRVYDKRHRRE